MTVYVLEIDSFVKIGVSYDFDQRLKAYSGVKRIETFHIPNDEFIANYIETRLMDNFNSETEYIYNQSFENVVKYAFELINSLEFKSVDFKPLGIEIECSNEGYYGIDNIMEYISSVRKKKGKNKLFIADYIKTKATKEFLDITYADNKKKPIITKVGAYGGTIALPYVVIDILLWSDVTIKYDVMNWMWNDKKDYLKFCNPDILFKKAKEEL